MKQFLIEIPLQLKPTFSVTLIYSFCQFASKTTQHPCKQVNT